MRSTNDLDRKRHHNVMLVLLFVCFVIETSKPACALPRGSHGDPSLAAGPEPAECRLVFEATDKLLAIPHHVYLTETASSTNGKPRQTELIFVGGVFYVRVSGKWTKSPLTAEQNRAQEQENRKNATNESCRHLRDEAVGGESAAVYTAHAENEGTVADTQVWISKSRGLILKQEEDFGEAGAKDRTHMSIRYEYGNIQAPRM
jgi:hypothetical protein